MKFILGKKQNMTEYFSKDGEVIPVTVVTAGPVTVTRILEKSKDGYDAVQVGFGERNAKNINKPMKGHMKNGNYAYLKEFRTEKDATFAEGDKIDLSIFSNGDLVTVSGTSKGKGFQGVVKRHGFKGGPRSHGQKHSEREPGSIGGAGRDGGRVAKGKRMAGRTGSDRITAKGMTIVNVNPETNEIFVRGAVPGRRGSLVEIVG